MGQTAAPPPQSHQKSQSQGQGKGSVQVAAQYPSQGDKSYSAQTGQGHQGKQAQGQAEDAAQVQGKADGLDVEGKDVGPSQSQQHQPQRQPGQGRVGQQGQQPDDQIGGGRFQKEGGPGDGASPPELTHNRPPFPVPKFPEPAPGNAPLPRSSGFPGRHPRHTAQLPGSPDPEIRQFPRPGPG